MNFVTEQMEKALTALQTVEPHDYAGAYYAAYSGIAALDPRGHDLAAASHADLIYGRSLALNVWKNTMRRATASA